MKTIDPSAGSHISEACERAAKLATQYNEPVAFTFNDTAVVVQPGESAAGVESRWHHDFSVAAEAYRNSEEYKQAEAKRAEEYRAQCAAPMKESASTEAEMRESKVPRPYTEAQLMEYIRSLVDRSHDYGTCVYAMSMAATAAFNYVAHKLGASGFQLSCADLDILRRTRSLDGPFILLKGEDALYPQYNLHTKLTEALDEWRPWLREQAQKKLDNGSAHPIVEAHWRKLAGEAK